MSNAYDTLAMADVVIRNLLKHSKPIGEEGLEARQAAYKILGIDL